MRAVITTTINVPYNLTEWRRHMDDDDVVVVAGDRKTPDLKVREFMATLPGRNFYLSPNAQELAYPKVSETMGWNCIQRRNLAVLKAMELGPKTITTIDDDNYPLGDDWFSRLDEYMRPTAQRVTSCESGWFDPGSLCVPSVVHRGYPLEQRHAPYVSPLVYASSEPRRIGVLASLWVGDPDIDAVERIVTNPWVTDVIANAVLDVGTWAPFNSQATTVVGELAPLLFMWPGVGRYDDIWASYLARVIMDARDWHVRYGAPTVKQTRNEHDLIKDLENEMFGMRHNQEVIDILRIPLGPEIVDSSAGVNHLMREVMRRFVTVDFMPRQTLEAYDAWYRAIAEIERKRYATS